MSSANNMNFTDSPSWNLDLESAGTYIKSISKILAEYSWIYNVKNTEILIHNVLERIPFEWTEAVLTLTLNELKQLPFGFIKDSWPLSLKSFITQCTELAKLRFLKSVTLPERNKVKTQQFIEKNIPLKKKNEIVAISSLIYKICTDVQCHKILDMGSGLGYLDQILHQIFGLQCIGLDALKRRTEGAKCRLEEDPCFYSMQHETLLVKNTDDCIEKLRTILKNVHNTNLKYDCISHVPEFIGGSENAYVMIGLHCCGSLMQDMMKLFCRMSEIKAFVCVGCCYNKINISDFPMSQTAQTVIDSVAKIYPGWYPCVYGLRLGSHATRADLKIITPEVLENREKSLFYRAVLQFYITKENIPWQKPKRRIRRRTLISFEKYCDSMFQNDEEILSNSERNERMEKLSNIYDAKANLFPRVRVLLILQMLLQPLWECFVILDRMLYFKEKSVATEVLPVWDDSISPRNIALCAYKS